ncbi:DNA-binding protein [Agrobacterium tumefaciens]
MTEISHKTELSREHFCRPFSEHRNPTLKTTVAVMRALDVEVATKLHLAQ